MVGSAIARRLNTEPSRVLVGADGQPDWTDAAAVDAFLADVRPDEVIVAAGRAAGIAVNQRSPADLMLENLLVAAHLVPAAWRHDVSKLLYLASSCTYPRAASQPFKVGDLWTGPVEPTSAAYATAKLAGLRLCEAYRQQHAATFLSVVAADVFGPGDDFSQDGSGHVISALIARMHHAKVSGAPRVVIWGTGAPRREFLHADDLADALLFLMQIYEGPQPINIGTGVTTSIRELAEMVRETVAFGGELAFDVSRPDGAPVKWLDSSPLRALGWAPTRDLRESLASTYQWFLDHQNDRSR